VAVHQRRSSPLREKPPSGLRGENRGSMTHLAAFIVGLALLGFALAAGAQPATNVPKIGYLSWADPVQDQVLAKAFIQGLRERGYVEGQSIAIEYRRGPTERLSDFAAELVHRKVDAFVTIGTPAALAAKQATSTIPIVIALIADPVAAGLVTSLARPGRNITGLSMFGVWGKALELLVATVPGVSRVAVLMDPTNAGHVVSKKDVDAAANALGVKVQRIDVQTVTDLDAAFATGLRQQVDAFYVFPLQTALLMQRIIEFAVKNRVPTLMTNKDRVREGGLLSYTVNFEDQVRLTAGYIDRILKGAKPADLPIAQPTEFELAINLKTARALGLAIPSSVLLRANHVFDQ
jgi:putative tryptophan/tyrosine transport system substrate-binding protein